MGSGTLIVAFKKAAPSLDMQDARWLVGIGRVSKSVFGEGADKQTSLFRR